MALLDDLLIMGSPLQKSIRNNVEAASIDGSLSQITQLSFTVSDKGWALLNTGLIRQGMSAALHDFVMEINAISLGNDSGIENFTITARPLIYRSLFNRRGTKVMKNASPTDFIKAETLAVHGKFVGESSSNRKSVSRDVPQKGEVETADNPYSSWTTFGRLANEIGYVMFESCGTIYFAKPSWFVQNLTKVDAYYVQTPKAGGFACLSVPTANRSEDDPAITISANVRVERPDQIRPGFAFTMHGVPTFSEFPLMVSSFSVDLLDPIQQCQVQAATPSISVPSLTTGANSASAFPRIGTKLSSDFVYWVKKQIGDPIRSTASTDLSQANPSSFTAVSELAAWASSQVGVFLPTKAADQMAYCISQGTSVSISSALNTAGAILLSKGNAIHISIGGSHVIEQASNGRVAYLGANASLYMSAARIPGLLY